MWTGSVSAFLIDRHGADWCGGRHLRRLRRRNRRECRLLRFASLHVDQFLAPVRGRLPWQLTVRATYGWRTRAATASRNSSLREANPLSTTATPRARISTCPTQSQSTPRATYGSSTVAGVPPNWPRTAL